MVAHNAPYDLAVLARAGGDEVLRAVWGAIHEGRVVCTRVRERLVRVALGELELSAGRDPDSGQTVVRRTPYDLAGLVRRYFGVEVGGKSGDDAWRLRYSELDGVPPRAWPEAAVDYAVLDAAWALDLAAAQLAAYPHVLGGYSTRDEDGRPRGEVREVAAAWALHLAATWGLRTDPDRVPATLADWSARAEAGRAVGRAHGWVRPDGSRDTRALQAAVEAALGPMAPRTKPSSKFPNGQVQYGEEVLTRCGGDLAAFATSLTWTGVAARWAHVLPLGAAAPLTSRPEVLLETGRTGWSDPPLQQPPREGGVRECFVPRPGFVLVSVDLDVAELVALAQVCLWAGLGSSLASAINGGRDPHTETAAEMLGVSYDELAARVKAGDEAAVEARQIAKALNFGLPGGLQAEGFGSYARGYGIDLSPERAASLHAWWHRSRPEVRAYYAWVESQVSDGVVQQAVSGRLRGGVRYTAALNGYFQGLVADAAKYGLVVASSCAYTGTHPDVVAGALPGVTTEHAAAFRGARPVLFVHDEVIAEVPAGRASEAADALVAILAGALQRHCPDVRAKAGAKLMNRWSKAAKSPRGPDGRLVVWEAP